MSTLDLNGISEKVQKTKQKFRVAHPRPYLWQLVSPTCTIACLTSSLPDAAMALVASWAEGMPLATDASYDPFTPRAKMRKRFYR